MIMMMGMHQKLTLTIVGLRDGRSVGLKEGDFVIAAPASIGRS